MRTEGRILALHRLVEFAAADFQFGVALVVVEQASDAEPFAREEQQRPLLGVAFGRGEEQPHDIHPVVGDVVSGLDGHRLHVASGAEGAVQRSVFDAVEFGVPERRRDAGRTSVIAARGGKQQGEEDE